MRTLQIVSLLIVGVSSLACNVCEDLDERVCGDLGPEDCTVWKEKELNFTAQAKTRPRRFLRSLLFGPDAESCRAAGSEPAYSQIVAGLKAQMPALRQAQ
jgi:hypothetical protein